MLLVPPDNPSGGTDPAVVTGSRLRRTNRLGHPRAPQLCCFVHFRLPADFSCGHANARSQHGPICFVGDSHSRGLHVYATRRYGPNRSHYLRADFPDQLLDTEGNPGRRASFLDSTAHWVYRGGSDPAAKSGFTRIPEVTLACSVMFVSVGQWALSSQTHGKPFSASRYRREMEQLAARLKAYNVNAGRPVAVLHSLNYSPLGFDRLRCPGIDWRTPDRIEEFNAVLQQVALKAGLHFVDTTDVIGPIWDSGTFACPTVVPACAVMPPHHSNPHPHTLLTSTTPPRVCSLCGDFAAPPRLLPAQDWTSTTILEMAARLNSPRWWPARSRIKPIIAVLGDFSIDIKSISIEL